MPIAYKTDIPKSHNNLVPNTSSAMVIQGNTTTYFDIRNKNWGGTDYFEVDESKVDGNSIVR